MSSETVTNGNTPHSQFLSHLTSFPVVSDGITTYKTNPYGAKSISFANQVLSIVNNSLYKPLSPYLRGPYSYVAPYVAKADSLGDHGLVSLESRFPIVKEDTATVQKTVTGIAGYPLELADQGKKFVLETYDERYKFHEGKTPYFRVGYATFDTQLVVISVSLNKIASFLSRESKEAKAEIEKKINELKN